MKNENTVLCLYFIVKNGTSGFSLLSETGRLQRVVLGPVAGTLQVLWVVCVLPLLRRMVVAFSCLLGGAKVGR